MKSIVQHIISIVFLLTLTISEIFAFTYTVSNTNDNGAGSFRQALQDASANVGGAPPHSIVFNILPSGGVKTILLSSPLPSINNANFDNIIVDASTQPGFAGVPLIELRGPGYGYGFDINGRSGVFIKGFIINNFNMGIVAQNSASSFLIKGNYIGTNSTGTAAFPNTQHGIQVTNNCSNFTIGGSSVSDRNVISGNTNFGIDIESSSNATIIGNYIGLNALGTSSLTNGSSSSDHAIRITFNDNSNTSYTATIENNIIASPNAGSGIDISMGINIQIQNNLIGTDAMGTTLLGTGTTANNAAHGIYMNNSVSPSITGNTVAGSKGGNGIYLDNNCQSATIKGNKVGTNTNGLKVAVSFGNYIHGIFLNGGNNHIIGGAAVADRNIVCDNGDKMAINDGNVLNERGDGIHLFNTSNCFIKGNYVGVDATGTGSFGNDYNGIYIQGWPSGSNANNNQVGGVNAGEGNVICSNGFGDASLGRKRHGLQLDGATNCKVWGNLVGLGSDGSTVLGNSQDGISIYRQSNNNQIGGNTAAYRNISSGNEFGLFMQDNCQNNLILGNFFGTDVNGTVAKPNNSGGVAISWDSRNNYVGRANVGEGNVISGNSEFGLQLRADGSGPNPCYNNFIENNYIGVDITGLAALPNGKSGILILGGAHNNIIGGTGNLQRNIISGNAVHGIEFYNGDNNSFFNNYIGLNAAGNAMGNGEDGIYMNNGNTGNIIGGVNTNEGNIIAHNGSNGITILDAASFNNSIHKNSFYCNGLRAIELNGAGNNNYAKPTFSGTPSNFTVTGPAGSFIELYSLDGCNSCSITSNNKLQGMTLVASGPSPLSYTPGGGLTNLDFTATASAGSTTAAHNTSEFSICQILCISGIAATSASSDRDGFCSDDAGNITLTATGGSGSSLAWYTSSCGGTLVGTGNNLSIASPSVSTTYFARWEGTSGCSNSNCVSVTVTPVQAPVNPSLASTDRNDFCASDDGTITLTATGGSGETLTWYSAGCGTSLVGTGNNLSIPSPQVSTTFYVRWESSGCTPSVCSSTPVTVNADPAPSVSGTFSQCPGASNIVYTTTDNSASGNTYSWTTSGDITVVSGSSTPDVTVNIGTSGGTLTVTESSGGCSVEDQQTVSVLPATTSANAGADQTVCSGSAVLNANTSGTWTVALGSGTFTPSVNAANAVVSGLSNGLNRFYWTVTGSCGTSIDSTDIIYEISDIIVEASTSEDTVCAGSSVDLTLQASGGSGNYTFIWSSSDNSFNSSSANTTTTVTPEAGTIIYYIQAQDNLNTGCISNIDSVYIRSIDEQKLIFPNLITPNDDAKNDLFLIKDIYNVNILPGASFDVYNRWGERVYKSESYSNNWGGSNLPDGMYFYNLKTGCGNKEYKGWVQIISNIH